MVLNIDFRHDQKISNMNDHKVAFGSVDIDCLVKLTVYLNCLVFSPYSHEKFKLINRKPVVTGSLLTDGNLKYKYYNNG